MVRKENVNWFKSSGIWLTRLRLGEEQRDKEPGTRATTKKKNKNQREARRCQDVAHRLLHRNPEVQDVHLECPRLLLA